MPGLEYLCCHTLTGCWVVHFLAPVPSPKSTRMSSGGIVPLNPARVDMHMVFMALTWASAELS